MRPAVRAVAGVGRYAVCVSAWLTAAFCDPNVAPQAPQPYEATSVAFARIAFPFGFFLAAGFLALLVFAPVFAFAGALVFGSFAAFVFGSRAGFSVP